MAQRKVSILHLLKELLIVVFGILIAFGLNNWAEKRQEYKLARTYLESLHADLASNY